MKKIVHILLLCFLSMMAVAQKTIDFQILDGVKKFYGIDKKLLTPDEWKASWIWRKGETYANNVMICVRKTFNLEQKPSESKLYITADSHYSLWVNGEFINRGPARSAPHHQSFDILDISSKLKVGKNVIAIKVHHSGNTISYVDKVRPGLLFQLEIPTTNETIFINSDKNIKVRNEVGWDTETPQIDGSNMARVENFDYNKSVIGWEQPEFDDSGWENAALIQHKDWWPPRKEDAKDFARMPPWYTLVPRDILYLEENLRSVKSVFETGECAEFGVAKGGVVKQLPILGVVQHQVMPLKHCKIENLDKFMQGKENLTIENSYPKTIYVNEPFRSTWIVFDMGELLMGYPKLDIKAEKGTNVNITYAPFLIDGKYNPAIIPDNQGDRVVLSGKKTSWEAQELRTFRYIGLLISDSEKPVTIFYAGVKQTFYPFKDNAPIKLGDPFLEKLYEASRKTMKIITHDAYTDNYRERRQYIQTGFYAARGNYSLFGDPYLMRRQLIQIAQDQFANGFLPMHAPGKPKAGILDADLMWHMSLYDYYMYTGDEETTKSLLLNLQRNLLALDDLVTRNGVIENLSHPYWIDHTNLDLRGINFTLNAWYLIALEDDAKLFRYFGMEEDADVCSQRAQKTRKYLKSRFWNQDKGLFVQTEVDGKQTGLYDEISNSIALMTGIADAGQAKSITEKILQNDKTQEMVRPVIMMYWPIEGLFSAGYGKEAIQLLKSRYEVMMQHEEGTLWEGWSLYSFNHGENLIPKIRSATQAEQVFHPDIFARHLLGYEIVKPGSKEIRISYNGYNLKNMEGVIPTPQGNVTISWNIEGKNKLLEIESPHAMKVTVNRTGFPKGIKINQKKY